MIFFIFLCIRLNCTLYIYFQVVAVEGINNYSGILIPSKIYDEVQLVVEVRVLLFDDILSLVGYHTSLAEEKSQIYCWYVTCKTTPYRMQLPRDDPLPTFLPLGFTMVAATGPFTTSDNLEMDALRDLVDVVKQEKPDLLVLVMK